MREGDVVVRYGGEEFVVIAPATDGDGAVHAAERIRAAVAAVGSEPVDGRLVPLTISAGVASLVDETDGRGLFRAADSALLAAKRAGRDRVSRIWTTGTNARAVPRRAEPRIATPDGAGEGAVRAPERAHLKVRERGAQAATRARAVRRGASRRRYDSVRA